MSQKSKLKIVILESQRGSAAPFVVRGMKKALSGLGNKIISFDLSEFDAKKAFSIKDYKNLLNKIKSAQADFVLSYGALRLKAEEACFYNDIQCPYVALFYDNPLMYLQEMGNSDFIKLQKAENFFAFCSDKEFITDLKKIGFKNAQYLPLAADPQIFYPLDKNDKRLKNFYADVVFVGSILDNPQLTQAKRRILWSKLPQLNRTIDFLTDVAKNPNSSDVVRELNLLKKDMDWRNFIVFSRTVFEEANSFIRINTLRSINKFEVSVYGNPGWKKFLTGNMHFKGSIDYEEELNLLYNASKINLNITSPQLVNAVTQRLFDVSSCAGFVISDYRADLKFLFGNCIVSYKNVKDLNSKIDYYLSNPKERQELALAARGIVLKRHTWQNRAQNIIDFVLSKRRAE